MQGVPCGRCACVLVYFEWQWLEIDVRCRQRLFIRRSAFGLGDFVDGERSKTITLAIAGDYIKEENEDFIVTLSGPFGVSLGIATATGVITDDDWSEARGALSPIPAHPTRDGRGGECIASRVIVKAFGNRK